jgi:hypothetical protein
MIFDLLHAPTNAFSMASYTGYTYLLLERDEK